MGHHVDYRLSQTLAGLPAIDVRRVDGVVAHGVDGARERGGSTSLVLGDSQCGFTLMWRVAVGGGQPRVCGIEGSGREGSRKHGESIVVW